MIPPTRGARTNTHTFVMASPPTKSAGPKLLAGFTLVPVRGIPTRWTSTRASPITIPATLLFSVFDVTPSIAITKTNVKIISIRNEIPASPLYNPLTPRPVSSPTIPSYSCSPAFRSSFPARAERQPAILCTSYRQ